MCISRFVQSTMLTTTTLDAETRGFSYSCHHRKIADFYSSLRLLRLLVPCTYTGLIRCTAAGFVYAQLPLQTSSSTRRAVRAIIPLLFVLTTEREGGREGGKKGRNGGWAESLRSLSSCLAVLPSPSPFPSSSPVPR